MDEQTNIFLRILQIGVDGQGDPICFNEIIVTIKNEFKVPENMIPIIRRWFYDYFHTHHTFRVYSGTSSNDLPDAKLKQYDDEKAYFTGDGFFKYYEYLEVKKAFENAQIAMENAQKSTEQSKKALQWVIIAFVASVLIGLAQILSTGCH